MYKENSFYTTKNPALTQLAVKDKK